MGSEYATGDPHAGNIGMGGAGGVGGGFKKGHRRKNTGMAKAAVGSVKEWVGETGAVMGLWRGENVKTKV